MSVITDAPFGWGQQVLIPGNVVMGPVQAWRGYRSIMRSLRALACDSKGVLMLGGAHIAENRL